MSSLAPSDALGQTTYKTRTLTALRKHYTNLLISSIGNTDIDAKSYRSQGMLILLVQPDKQLRRHGEILRFPSWARIGEFFRMNREVLRDPARLRAAVRGEELLRLPDAAPVASSGRQWV